MDYNFIYYNQTIFGYLFYRSQNEIVHSKF
jgi:hypothetical protein